jgi:predicted GIY-YIG superfamily endonuclease
MCGSNPQPCTKRGEEMDYRQIKAIEKSNKERLLKVDPKLTEESGIYILTREENGFKYAYIGQAKHILTRLADHLKASSGIFTKYTQHIDYSIRKHGLFSTENPTGWNIVWVRYPEYELDSLEQDIIKKYANAGYQLRNKTAGGQGDGKFEIAETKPRKNYHDGLKQGYEKAQKEVKRLFEKNLTYSIQGKENKNKLKAYEKFTQFIGGANGQ